jgi:hypothetical protein
MKKCQFEDKPCKDRYISHHNGTHIRCRIDEWKRKKAVCPYDSSIQSKPKIARERYMIAVGQKKLI